MKKVLLVVLILGLPALMLASNMGFKAQINKTAGGSNVWWVSFPYFYDPNGDGSVNSAEVCTDATNLAGIVAWNAATGQTDTFTCGGFTTPFTISKGVSYRFAGNTTDPIQWTAVGSHDPSYNHSYAPGGSNVWWVSVPYHWNPAGGVKNAAALCAEVNNLAGVVEWNASIGQTNTFTCGGFTTPFTIDVFSGYRFAGNTTDTITWTPTHY